MRFDWDRSTTYDPTEDAVTTFKYRTTLVTRYTGEQVNWDELEFFECAEEWKGREEVRIDLVKEHSVIITILERKSVGLEEYGDYERPQKKRKEVEKEKEEKEKDVAMAQEEEKQVEIAKQNSVEEMEEENRKALEELFPSEPPGVDESKREEVEEKLPSLGEREEEAMIVAGEEISPDSTLKKMGTACEFLKIGKTGSKARVWKRIKQAVATSKMKELVEISKGLEPEFSRDPRGEKQPKEPTEEERRKHELTHLPKADWCTSCQATRSREDNFEVSEKTIQASLVTMDFKFTGTRDEENKKDSKDALTIGLVMVDQATKFVHVIPAPSNQATSYLVEEVCRVLMLLNSKVILRNDTEPAMISSRKKVQGIRKMNNLDTAFQDVAPDEHQGLQERWVQTVRNVSKTLIYGVESEAKFQK